MTGQEVLALLERRKALLDGHFVLSSGRHSQHFVQKFRIFEEPVAAEAIGTALADRLRPYAADVVVSAAVGGILPGYIVAKNLGVRNIFTEKEDGSSVLRRGFALSPGERAVIVEDVMTTGRSSVEVAKLVKEKNAQVTAIGTIVKRGKAELPFPVLALLELPLADYAPDDCPLCRRGLTLEDPGSRRIVSLKR